jgi:hypothetical protein
MASELNRGASFDRASLKRGQTSSKSRNSLLKDQANYSCTLYILLRTRRVLNLQNARLWQGAGFSHSRKL